MICGVSNHPSGSDDTLAAHVHEGNMVHEATHCIDFRRSGHLPHGFQVEDMFNLRGQYYNRPHESSAHFHQGLYSFLRDLDIVKSNLSRFGVQDRSGRRRYLHGILWDDSYWPGDFVRSLKRRNERRFLRRVFHLLTVLLPGF